MALLSVTVKKALYVGVQATQYNTYVTLKLQNVKSTTVTVKGPNPCWEQDFLFETNDVNSGLLIEVWSKGMLWDRALGYHWIPLPAVKYSNEEGIGQWVSLEGELVMRDGEVVGTKNPTGHSLLLDCRFELPFGRWEDRSVGGWRRNLTRDIMRLQQLQESRFELTRSDPENTEGADLQRKLEMLNSIMDQEARAEQARRQLQYYGHSGYSEDSDYTSDLNYPVGQHANSSASQFRGVANQMCTPQRSLETSRENSYERDDVPARVSPAHPSYRNQQHLLPRSPRQLPDDKYSYGGGETSRRYADNESEPLFYNSRPRNYKEHTSGDAWYESGYSASYSQEHDDVGDVSSSVYPGDVDAKVGIYADDGYYQGDVGTMAKRSIEGRRPSLERQTTLYDDQYYADGTYYDQTGADQQGSYAYDTTQQGYANDYYATGQEYAYQDDRYGQEEEDRQWDSGGYYYPDEYTVPADDQYKNTVNERCTSATLPQPPVAVAYPSQEVAPTLDDTSYYTPNQQPYDETAVNAYPGAEQYPPSGANRRRLLLQQKRQSGSRQSSLEEYNYTPGYYDEYPIVTSTSTTAPTTTTVTQVASRSVYQKPVLPQIPNHVTAERRNSVKPAVEYAQDDSYASYYDTGDTGAEVYNEDYNYAYRSTDNLTPMQDSLEDKTDLIGRYSRRNAARQAYKQQSDEYYYSCQDREYSEDLDSGYLDTQPLESNRKKLVTRRDNSPLLQQNTDSLESRDDELRDSFETAVSSISSSLHPRKGYPDYTTAVETPPTTTISVTEASAKSYNQTTDSYKPLETKTSLHASAVSQAARTRDQDITSAAATIAVSASVHTPTSSSPTVHSNTVLSVSYPSQVQRGYMRTQESLDSCAEEVANLSSSAEYAKNARESPASVMMDRYGNHTPIDPLPPRIENSLIEPYQPTPSKTVVMSPSPPQITKQHSIDESRMGTPSVTGSGESQKSQKSKSVSFEDEEQVMPPPTKPVVERRKMTAKERWHFAYNKIIMQLNVSILGLLTPG